MPAEEFSRFQGVVYWDFQVQILVLSLTSHLNLLLVVRLTSYEGVKCGDAFDTKREMVSMELCAAQGILSKQSCACIRREIPFSFFCLLCIKRRFGARPIHGSHDKPLTHNGSERAGNRAQHTADRMFSLAARRAIVAAGLDMDNKAYTVLDELLNKAGIVQLPTDTTDLSSLYAALNWSKSTIRSDARTLWEKRRADPILAKAGQLQADIDDSKLEPPQKEQLKSDVREVFMRGFGAWQEDHSIKTFQKATSNSLFFADRHQRLLWINYRLIESVKQQRRTFLTVSHSFPELGLHIQGLPDMREGSALFELKNRFYAEEHMSNEYRRADHAQLAVSIEQSAMFRLPHANLHMLLDASLQIE